MNIAAFDFDFVKFAVYLVFVPIFGHLFHTWLNRPLNEFSTELTLSHTLNSTERAATHERIFIGLKEKVKSVSLCSHCSHDKTTDKCQFTRQQVKTLHLSMQPPTD